MSDHTNICLTSVQVKILRWEDTSWESMALWMHSIHQEIKDQVACWVLKLQCTETSQHPNPAAIWHPSSIHPQAVTVHQVGNISAAKPHTRSQQDVEWYRWQYDVPCNRDEDNGGLLDCWGSSSVYILDPYDLTSSWEQDSTPPLWKIRHLQHLPAWNQQDL